jgi:MYXO-CTERM domain-containing protein
MLLGSASIGRSLMIARPRRTMSNLVSKNRDGMGVSGMLAIVAAMTFVPGRDAVACPPTPNAFWTLTGTLPPAEQLVATDGVFLLTGRPWTTESPNRDGYELARNLEATVRDEAGQLVAGNLEAWYVGDVPTALWRPAAPLPPNASFRLEATAVPGETPRPADAVGETRVSSDFRTGAAPDAPLRVAGAMRVSLERYEQMLWDCGACNSGECKSKGSATGVRARIHIPEVQGGYPAGGYAAWVWMTEDQPFFPPPGRPSFHGGSGGRGAGLEKLATGAETDILRSLGDQERICVSARVFDPADHYVDLAPECLPRSAVDQPVPRVDPPTSGGCALTTAGDPGGTDFSTSGAALVVLGLIVVLRRRRSSR